MKRLTLLLCLIPFTILAQGIQKEFSYESYEKALAAKSKIEFHMESTKAGLFTSTFVGVVKRFNISASLKNSNFEDGRIEFLVEDMDTDLGARNSKMYDYCFDIKKHPKVIIDILSSVPANGTSSAEAIITVRGKQKKIKVDFDIQKVNDKFFIVGSSFMTLSALEIPDPSIIVASVRDSVEVRFKVEL